MEAQQNGQVIVMSLSKEARAQIIAALSDVQRNALAEVVEASTAVAGQDRVDCLAQMLRQLLDTLAEDHGVGTGTCAARDVRDHERQ